MISNPPSSSAQRTRPDAEAATQSAASNRSDGAPEQDIRDVLDRSSSGAPAAGEALRDLFSTDEIFHRLVAAADEEFSRSNRLLFLSGLAAGLSLSLSFLANVALAAQVSGPSAYLVGSLLYPLGFLSASSAKRCRRWP